jgi:hypothetical protein
VADSKGGGEGADSATDTPAAMAARRVQSSTFWDHINIVDIVMQVIGILSSYICFVRRHLTILGAKPLPLKLFKNDTLTM